MTTHNDNNNDIGRTLCQQGSRIVKQSEAIKVIDTVIIFRTQLMDMNLLQTICIHY